MTMLRTILVPLDGRPSDSHCLAVAGNLAQLHKAHLLALFPDPDPVEMLSATMFDLGGGAFFNDEIVNSFQREANARRDEAKRRFSEWRTQIGLPEATQPGEAPNGSAVLRIEAGMPQPLMRRFALGADLVVTALPKRGEVADLLALEVALLDAGRPVLALPEGAAPSADEAPVAIAWNGSAESACAMTAALPLLKGSGMVAVLHAGKPDPLADPKMAVRYLAWHGIGAHAVELGDRDDPELLIAVKTAELGARLLVMGAYTHSRAREFVFGGVTRHMLHSAKVPLLLAH